jgi:urate oxidase
VYAFAKEYGIESAEQFGIHLARHFVTSQEPIHRARIRIEEYAWERIETSDANSRFIGADDVKHSFVRKGQEVRLTQITFDGEQWEVISGLKDLVVMNSTNSEFWGYVKDKYTTLQEAYDRILATQVAGRWRFNWTDDAQKMPNWEKSYEQVKKHMLHAFAETYSLSLQQTMYQMGSRIINNRSEIDEVRFSLPNKHHFLVDLEPFGLKNDNEVYFAADRPYGLIEATILRDGCEARIPVDMTNL